MKNSTIKVEERKLRSRRRLLSVDGRSARLTRDARYRARRRGLPFDLDKDWIAERLQSNSCALSGLPFDLRLDAASRIYSPSVDRVVPELGYVKSNCRLVLNALNSLRGLMTDAALVALAAALVAHHNRGTTK